MKTTDEEMGLRYWTRVFQRKDEMPIAGVERRNLSKPQVGYTVIGIQPQGIDWLGRKIRREKRFS